MERRVHPPTPTHTHIHTHTHTLLLKMHIHLYIEMQILHPYIHTHIHACRYTEVQSPYLQRGNSEQFLSCHFPSCPTGSKLVIFRLSLSCMWYIREILFWFIERKILFPVLLQSYSFAKDIVHINNSMYNCIHLFLQYIQFYIHALEEVWEHFGYLGLKYVISTTPLFIVQLQRQKIFESLKFKHSGHCAFSRPSASLITAMVCLHASNNNLEEAW